LPTTSAGKLPTPPSWRGRWTSRHRRLANASEELENRPTTRWIDGYNGTVIVTRRTRRCSNTAAEKKQRRRLDEKLREIIAQPAVTLDGKLFIFPQTSKII